MATPLIRLSADQRARKQALEQIVKNHLNTTREALTALQALHDQRLFLEEYETFEEYIFATFGVRRSQGYRLLEHAKTLSILDNESPPSSPNGRQKATAHLPENERQTRELKGLKPKEMIRTWQRALEIAGDKEPTAEQVKQARHDFGDAVGGKSNKVHAPKPIGADWKEYEECLGKVIRHLDMLAKLHQGERQRLKDVETSLRSVAMEMKRFSRGPSRQIYQAEDGPAKWQMMLARSRGNTGRRTFRAAEALFFRENGAWPNPAWPGMPMYEDDRYRLVADVPPERLIGS